MSQYFDESLPATTHYITGPFLSDGNDAQQYHQPTATDNHFFPDGSAHYYGLQADMRCHQQPIHQGLPSASWSSLETPQDRMCCQPSRQQHFLPHYAHVRHHAEFGSETAASTHGYAPLDQQKSQLPLASDSVEKNPYRPGHSTAAPNASPDGLVPGPTASSKQQVVHPSRSRRTSRATYPHNSPGPPKASPVQRFTDASGKEFMRFEYTMNRKKTQVELRCDIEHIDVASLSTAFKRDNACYKEAGDGNIDEATIRARMYERGKTESEMRTRLRRMKYEVDCNRIGWKLVTLNGDKLAGRKGMIQRAADSYRNSGADLNKHSRRMNREIMKARRRAADEEASRHEPTEPIKEEYASASPTDPAAQSPLAEALQPYQSYGFGFGFGPIKNASVSPLPQSSQSFHEADVWSLSSASASGTMPPTPHSSSQVLAAPHVRIHSNHAARSYSTQHDDFTDPQIHWQMLESQNTKDYFFPITGPLSIPRDEQEHAPWSVEPTYEYYHQW